jgi:CTP:molybdopterin cytidylyltransferase MocA
MQVAAVILAAGASTRFGSPKQIARIGGATLLDAVARVAHQAGLHPVIAVVPPGFAVPADVVPEINDAPEEGMSRSLRLGLAAVPIEADAAVILLGDQPTVAVSSVRALTEAARGDRPVVASRANGRIGPPVLVMRDWFTLADAARGDEGLRSVLSADGHLVTAVEVGAHPPDVDTPADLAALDAG